MQRSTDMGFLKNVDTDTAGNIAKIINKHYHPKMFVGSTKQELKNSIYFSRKNSNFFQKLKELIDI